MSFMPWAANNYFMHRFRARDQRKTFGGLIGCVPRSVPRGLPPIAADASVKQKQESEGVRRSKAEDELI